MPFHPQHRHIENFAPDFFRDREARRYLQRFNSDVLGWLTPIGAKMAERHRNIISSMYDAEVATQDDQLGAFFDRLRQAGRLDNTLFIIVADHGEHLGEKHFIGHNVTLYNELTHVPMIVRDPSGALPRGSEWQQLVSTRRIFHTALAAAGMADTEEADYSLLNGPARDPDEGTVFAEAVTPQNVLNIISKHAPELVREHECDQERKAVWHGRHKLILTGRERVELFNYIDDPTEQHNLAEQQSETVQSQRERIQHFIRRTNDAAHAPGRITAEKDAHLRERLRALGYLE